MPTLEPELLHSLVRATATAALLGLASAAQANCESLAKQAATAAPDQIGPTFASLAACDAAMAAEHFEDFLRASKDVDTLVALSFAAIDAKVHQPVWGMLEKVTDMSIRDQVAQEIGARCDGHPEFVPFLRGAHKGLGDRQFGMWRESLRACTAPELDTWLGELAAAPPSVAYDEKYNVVSEAFVKRKRGEALSVMQTAAIAAGKGGGPFSTILDRMNDAVRPDTFGAQLSDEDRAKLEAALVDVAKQVSPELAGQVADRLYQAGAESAAASLLPTIYADRVQGKGILTYGVAAVEACDKEAAVHFAEVTEPSKRWSIVDDVQAPAKAFKPKLKCTPEGAWPILTTPHPLKKGELETWLDGIVKDWAGKGFDAKLREEKAIVLE